MVLRGTLVSMANMRWLEAVFCRLYTTVEADQDIDQPPWRLRPGPPVVQSPWNVLFCIPVCRLELAEVGTAEQVGPNACQHESLEDLGHGWQVGDRLVVCWLISMFGEFQVASPIILKILLICVQLISRCTLEFDRHQMKEVPLSFLNQTVSRSVYLLWSKLLCFFIGQRCYKYNRCACVLYLFL